MSMRDILEIISAFFGLISGGYFSAGVLMIKTTTLPRFAVLSAGELLAEELAKQKVDFAFGAAFLLLAFLVQVTTKIFPVMASVTATNDLLCGVVSSAFVALLFLLASYFIHRQYQKRLV